MQEASTALSFVPCLFIHPFFLFSVILYPCMLIEPVFMSGACLYTSHLCRIMGTEALVSQSKSLGRYVWMK